MQLRASHGSVVPILLLVKLLFVQDDSDVRSPLLSQEVREPYHSTSDAAQPLLLVVFLSFGFIGLGMLGNENLVLSWFEPRFEIAGILTVFPQVYFIIW